MVAIPVHDGRLLDAAQDLDRHVGRHGIDEHEAPGPRARGRRRVDDDDVGVAHPALVLVGRLHLERHLGVGSQDFLEEEVAGADERHRDLARRRQHCPRHVVAVEIVLDVQASGHRAAAVVRERQHDRAPHAGLHRDRLLRQRAAVDLQREVERLRLRRVVHERDERLVLEGVRVALAHGKVRDADVLAAPADADPVHTGIGGLRRAGQRVGAVGEDVDLRARVGAHQRARRAHGLRQPVGQVARVGGTDGRQRTVVVARERGRHRGLHPGLDHHHLGRLAQAAHELGCFAASDVEARRRDVVRLHRGGEVEDDHHLACALAHHRGHRPRHRQRERQQREDLEDQQRVALQPLEEGRRLTVAQDRLPQQEARHPPLAAADLEEVEQDQRQGQPEDREGQRGEEAHPRIRPRSCATTKASTGVSVMTRW